MFTLIRNVAAALTAISCFTLSALGAPEHTVVAGFALLIGNFIVNRLEAQ